MARYNVPGVGIAVIRNRRTVWHAELGVRAATGDEPITEDSVFEACSMSKALFAYAVLKLVEEGRLDLDRPLDAYLPSPYLPDQPEAGRITARMVLAHTTGLPNWRPGGWLRGGPLKLIARPGEKWTYSGEGFTYLQAVVEHLTGEAINDWMQHVLMRPLGMARSSYEWRDEYETSYAMGHNREGELKNFAHYRRGNTAFSLYTTPVEYSRLLCAMMAPRPRGAHMLSNAMREAMLVPQSRKDETTRCGLAWHIHEGEDGRYYFHGGANGAGFRCISRFDPTDGSGIVVMTNSDSGVEVYKRVVELWESRS
ncbi:beta-lactamase family protein [bacterium]|nr:beta-lactamase family protein [bacterium]